ncbi:hypothetical protein M1D52_14295 [Olivibacter sp. SA151]|uniref:hypothetical protein n=1 Tax=Olivibacter jilunii TaxID=985016 RepID=UPI003F166807
MNANKRVFQFIFFSLLLYLVFSYINIAYRKKWEPFDRINLISDVIVKPRENDALHQNRYTSGSKKVKQNNDEKKNDSLTMHSNASIDEASITASDSSKAKVIVSAEALPLNLNQSDIISFNIDSESVALSRFIKKLIALKNGKKTKVRIAYLGDSMIEGDLLSQTLRSLLQQAYGGSGVGFVPIASQVAQFRRTAIASSSANWRDFNFKNTKKQDLFISGHVFFSSGNDWVKIKDNTSKDTSIVLGKYLLHGPATDSASVVVNKKTMMLERTALFNRTLVAHNKDKSIVVSSADRKLPLFGLSFESDQGVIVDNFSFRGISGLELGKINADLLKEINEQNPYDLIIFQYGVNVLYKPDDTNFTWYKRAAIPVVKKIKTCFSKADVLIVGTGDRAFRYPEGYQSAVGIEALIKEQAALAKQTDCAFFSLYAAMGGKNSMVNWATQNPSLANKDYVHPNALGAKLLAKHLFEAINKQVKKSENTNLNGTD